MPAAVAAPAPTGSDRFLTRLLAKLWPLLTQQEVQTTSAFLEEGSGGGRMAQGLTGLPPSLTSAGTLESNSGRVNSRGHPLIPAVHTHTAGQTAVESGWHS